MRLGPGVSGVHGRRTALPCAGQICRCTHGRGVPVSRGRSDDRSLPGRDRAGRASWRRNGARGP
eukprot:5643-Eustigmatos_ZCMA.PRE.1